MKILLINNSGQTIACLKDVEKYDGTVPGHIAGMLDLLEALVASAKSSSSEPGQSVNHTAADRRSEVR